MLAYYSLTDESQVPIVILKSDSDGAIAPPSDQIVQLITNHYGHQDISRNYLKIKVKPECYKDGVPRELIVYRLFRDKYHYETDRLILDESFAVVMEEKNIKL